MHVKLFKLCASVLIHIHLIFWIISILWNEIFQIWHYDMGSIKYSDTSSLCGDNLWSLFITIPSSVIAISDKFLNTNGQFKEWMNNWLYTGSLQRISRHSFPTMKIVGFCGKCIWDFYNAFHLLQHISIIKHRCASSISLIRYMH